MGIPYPILDLAQLWKVLLILKGFPDSSVGKESICNAGDPGLIPGLTRSPGEEKGYPLQYSGLENCTDCTGHGIAKSRAQLSNFHFTFSFRCRITSVCVCELMKQRLYWPVIIRKVDQALCYPVSFIRDIYCEFNKCKVL